MRLRRRLSEDRRPESEASPSGRAEPATVACPHCGHEANRLSGRLYDPVTKRTVCVRCGADIGRTSP